MDVIGWLLDSDPALRWQVKAHLLDAPADEVAAERARVAREGWGARLLALQEPDGSWAGGAYFPASTDAPPEDGSQPWTATTWALALLRDLGADPDDPAVRSAVERVRDHVRWEQGGQRYFDGEVEPCVNGTALSLGAYFGMPTRALVDRLLADQLPDGGWNCWAPEHSGVSSFHSTICVLDGLAELERSGNAPPAAGVARRRGEEYLLERGLMRRRSTGEVPDRGWLLFSFPTRWFYDVLRGLEHLRASGAAPDPRCADAVELVRRKRSGDGTWPLEDDHPGAVHFPLEDGQGHPSRWNTLRALRVLRWWDGG
jgi:hypothetical protein